MRTQAEIARAYADGRTIYRSFNKNVTVNTTAGIAQDLSGLSGNPIAQYFIGTPGVATQMSYSLNDKGIDHGPVMSGSQKFLHNVLLQTVTAALAPCTLRVMDYLMFYAFNSMDTGEQTLINNVSLPRYSSGQMMMIEQNPYVGGATVRVGYTNQDGVSGRLTSSSSGLLLTFTNDFTSFTKVRFTTTTTLPTGLSLNTDYWLVRVSATTARVATSFANAIAGTVIAFTDAGTGTHTLTCRLPRTSSPGEQVQAIFFNPQATALGAGTPGLSLGYTNSAGVAARATPTTPSLPIGKTAATNSHILYTGATGAGKFGPFIPLQESDGGIQSIESIRNNATYTSGMYTVALVRRIASLPVQVLGQAVMMDFTSNMYPTYPKVEDGAALYGILKSGVATPANAAIDFDLNFGWS